MTPSLSERIDFKNKYSHLLFVLLLVFLAFPFLEDIKSEISLISLVCFLVVMFSLRALKMETRFFAFFIAFGVIAMFFDVLFWYQGNFVLKKAGLMVSLVLYVIFLVSAMVFMIKRIFSSATVTGDTIRMGISLYLLMGFLWTLFYYLILELDPNAFYYMEPRNDMYLMYYSFTTLTTVGYGDIFPINRFAMSLSNLEAIAGQMYMGIFVARLIGLQVVRKDNS